MRPTWPASLRSAEAPRWRAAVWKTAHRLASIVTWVAEPLVPDSYSQFLASLKTRIQTAQLHASLAVNRELVLLYWQIGRDILDRQARESWAPK
jgi:hypothetical protein